MVATKDSRIDILNSDGFCTATGLALRWLLPGCEITVLMSNFNEYGRLEIIGYDGL